ncbi:polymorphic toxin-type HINT domain-containing protein [Streptomyces sp. NPDC060010]|uniref:polymorphic toxin-type HINT domain-containing protein n=1 Tax=Streptomyces sp. NPDC060010 TaxID=3347036 RepID=UPI00367E3975
MNVFSRHKRGTARIAAVVSGVIVATLLQAAPGTPALANTKAPEARSHERPVKGSAGKVKPRTTKTPPAVAKPAITWPKAGSTTVRLAASAAPKPAASGARTAKTSPSQVGATGPLRVGTLPVQLGAAEAFSAPAVPQEVKVEVLDHSAAQRAGVDGVLLTLDRADSAPQSANVDVSLDYGTFARAAGASYGQRLKLVQLPSCALTTPDRPECRTATPLRSTNNPERSQLTAKQVSVPAAPHVSGKAGAPAARSLFAAGGGAVVLAAAPAAAGPAGSFNATPLAASGRWSADLNGGSFNWSYPLTVPAVPGDLKPELGLSYSSSSIDGRSANSNNQASWAGDGFGMAQGGFVERSYKSCGDDGVKDGINTPGDLCWGYDNATISFQGHSGELIPVSADEWRIQGDDNTKVVRLRDSGRGNGDNDGEYFKATLADGTQYFFGYNRLPNWATGKPETKSVFTVPVFGDDANEPCHASSFASSWCQQGWRWNLDLVIDPRGNDITYWYKQETNSYGRNLKAADDTPYVRGGWLERIDYGQQKGDLYSDTVKPTARITFTPAERCLETTAGLCDPAKIDTNRQYWYDTPWDMNCKAGTDCDKGRLAPTFFSRYRLSAITTQTLQSDNTYKDSDRWDLKHHWGTADNDYQLLLSSVQHTGLAGTTPLTVPPTTFSYTAMANRLDKDDDGRLPFHKKRLTSIADEFGGQIDANYSPAACTWSALPTPENNTTRCYPVKYQPVDDGPITNEWFNKYVVESVLATDRTGGAPDTMTKYTYLGGAAWHFDDDDGMTPEKLKTWSQWRGYGQTRVETGSTQAFTSQEDHFFIRGMDGDRNNPSDKTKTRSVQLSDGEGATITDDEAWRGLEYRKLDFDRPGGKVLQKQVTIPWKKETAKRVRDWGTTTANLVGISSTRQFTSLDQGAGQSWREVRKNTPTFDGYGRPTVEEDLGDIATPSDDSCTRTTYADNTTAWILTGTIRAEKVAGTCSKTVDRKTRADGTSDVLSDIRTRWDGQAAGAAPTKGLATLTSHLKSRSATQAIYLDNASTYDVYGRQLTTTGLASTSVFDPANESAAPTTTAHALAQTSTTAFTPATGRPTSMKVTSTTATAGQAASAQTVTTAYDSLRTQPVSVTDTSGRKTEVEYDALGRTRKVWQPNRSKANGQSPNAEFRYHTEEGKIAAVESLSLRNDGSQESRFTLYDGFARARQTQAPGANGGTVLTDTFYNAMGQTSLEYAPYYATKAPDTTLFKVEDATGVETQTATEFDSLNRPVKSTLLKGNGIGTPLAVTTTEYGGDRITVTPPQGATPTTTISDAAGKPTEVREYKATTPTGPYDTTVRAYDALGNLARLTDAGGSVWTWSYDQLGRQTKAVDPDTGTTITSYNDRNQKTAVKDGRDKTVSFVYDGLGRQLETRDGSASGPLLTSQTWDPTGAAGQLASSTRHHTVGGTTYQYKTTFANYDAMLRPGKTTLTVPSVPGQEALAGSYVTGSTFNLDGTQKTTSVPAAGNLPAETLSFTYDPLHQLTAVSSGLGSYLTGQTYTLTGKPLQTTLKAGGQDTWITDSYEYGTQRLATRRTDQYGIAQAASVLTYGYDQVGNVKSINDVTRSGTETQCFQHDYLARVSQEFTSKTTACPAQPTAAQIGGPAPYWNSYSYNPDGTRKTETRHDLSGDSAKNSVRTYQYPATGAAQPHTLLGTSTQTGTDAPVNQSYGYDTAGNTTSRNLIPTPGATSRQALTWNTEGKLNKLQDTITTPGTGTSTKTAEYIYTPDGSRLVAHETDNADPNATRTTLYLGSMELELRKGAAKPTATRYYALGSANAVREDNGDLSFQVSDHHNTGTLSVDSTTGAIEHRRMTPFGVPRGTKPANWAGTKGFVGGTIDATGLTHISAREYDPSTGRFISADPLLDANRPQTLNGYVYAANNPATLSDPSGAAIFDWVTDLLSPTSFGFFAAVKKAFGFARAVFSGKSHIQIAPGKQTCHYAMGSNHCSTSSPQYKLVNGPAAPVKEREKAVNTTSSGYPACPDCIGEQGNPLIMKEMAIAVCSAIPVLGTECDAYDLQRARNEGDTFGVAAGILGFIPFGDVLKLPKIIDRIIEAGKVCGKCFLPGTKVLMADESTKNIEDIKVGDTVLATDPATGETSPQKVTRLIETEDDKHFNELSIATPSGIEKLTATHEHPFWSPSKNDWVNASQLTPGTTLRTDTGETVVVTTNRAYTQHAKTYNLTVDALHTYYVLAGSTPVLVHNSGPCPTARFVTDANGVTIDLKPLGRGSTGRTAPNSLNEKLAMETVMANPTAGRVIPLKKGMTDPRWMGSDGWVKMTRRVNMGAEGDVEIHYVMNTITGHVDDYKFK